VFLGLFNLTARPNVTGCAKTGRLFLNFLVTVINAAELHAMFHDRMEECSDHFMSFILSTCFLQTIADLFVTGKYGKHV
jgi:hypothetical protein